MKKLVAMTFAAMTLVGCGSVCDDMLDATDTYQAKRSPCSNSGQAVVFNVTRCERNIDKCTAAEQDGLDEFADCLRKLPECTPSTKDTFDNAVRGCNLTFNDKVGEGCRNASVSF